MEVSWNLPPPVLCNVFQYLSLKDLANVSKICRQWNLVAKSEILWKFLSLKNLGLLNIDPHFSWKEWYRLHSKKNFKKFHLLDSRIILIWEKSFCIDESSNCQKIGIRNDRIVFSDHFIACTHLDGQKFFTGSYDKTIKFWNLDPVTGKFEQRQTLNHHQGAITALTGSGDWFFSASTDRTIAAWKFRNHKFSLHQILEGHKGPIQALCVFEDKLFSASKDKTIKIWKNNEGYFEEFQTLNHTNPLTTLESLPNPNKNQLLSGDEKGIVCIWQEQHNRLWSCEHIINAHQAPITAIRYHQPQRFFCTSGGNEVKLWKQSKSEKTWQATELSQNTETPILEMQLGNHHDYLQSGELYLLTEKEIHISWIDEIGVTSTHKTIESPSESVL